MVDYCRRETGAEMQWWSFAAAAAVVLTSGATGVAAKTAAKPAPKPAAAGAAAPHGGPAVYWMSASTTSGMSGGRPDMAAMMGGRYNPNAVSHGLLLQLGSPRRPSGDPTAEHDPPSGLGAGAVLPLITPVVQPVEHAQTPYERPQGRMLIYWGCGEHAGPNQPLVIDYAKLGQGAGAQQWATLAGGLTSASQGPSLARNATYGEWPNERSRSVVPGDGSLAGDHVVRGNYTPDINFALTAQQDFLPPFVMTTNAKNPSGSAGLGWRRVDGAAAYFASMMGSGGEGTTVMWTSSQVQASSFGLAEYLSDGDIARLLGSHVLLAPTTLSCTVPQEAVRAAGEGGIFNLAAYGEETNIAYPPKPATGPWSPIWTVKVRYRSSTGGMLGMDMSQMMRGDADDEEDRPSPPRRKSNPFGGLGNIMP
jgi:hypothetical protein